MWLTTWRTILLKWDSLVLSGGCILYGMQLFVYPTILQEYKVYQLIREIFDHRVIGAIFIFLGISKIVGIIFDNRILKKVTMRGILFVWLLFMIAFRITPPPNTVWITAFMAFMLGLGIIMKEE